MKSRPLVESYLRLASWTSFDNVLELGIMKGGSCAFVNLLVFRKIISPSTFTKKSPAWMRLPDTRVEKTGIFLARYDVSQTETQKILDIFETLAGPRPRNSTW